MNRMFQIMLVLAVFSLQGCGTFSVKRLTYDMLQSFGLQECRKDMSRTCEAAPSYDEYQQILRVANRTDY